MADELLKETKERTVDPVGVEFLLGVTSTLVTIIAALHQFGFFVRDRDDFLTEFEAIHVELMKLQNSLDDFVLLVQRYTSRTGDKEIEVGQLSISATMMDLYERDYYRWMDLQDTIKRLDSKIYKVVSRIRQLALQYRMRHPRELFAADLTDTFDDLLLRMGENTFANFIKDLRTLIGKISDKLVELIRHERE